MNTLKEIRDEMRRLLLYEFELGDATVENAELRKSINRAYAEVCYYAETPVLVYTFAYGGADDPIQADSSGHVIDLSRYGLRSVYRCWWRPRTATSFDEEIDLMDALYLQPDQDYRHLGAQRVVPDPTKEYRFPYPRVRWLPQRIVRGSNARPSTYAFADGKLILDAAVPAGQIRIIGAFVPSKEPNPPVPFLYNDDDRTKVPMPLNEAILNLAMSYWLMPYPDTIQFAQYYRATAFETIQMHLNVAQTGAFSRSPYSYAENMMGVIHQETVRRQKKGSSE